jgi:ATP-dependent helicase/nuclease subunit A
VIADSAYEFELAGPRARQARENLKKIRALDRRNQNRGYTTLARVTEHLDRLSAGDESNAAFDAVDAVNLMTVHAAKGLEFPIVFLVHLGKGAGGGRDPIRLSGVTEDETPSIAVGDFRSEADDDAALREREETKRLLYVAVTRARDRLYFSTVLADRGKQAVFLAGRGGLGDVLPPDFRQIFVDALPESMSQLAWISAGSAHRFRVCRVPDAPMSQRRQATTSGERPFDLRWLGGTESQRGSMAAADPSDRPDVAEAAVNLDADARLVGLIVHRLLDRFGVAPPGSANLDEAAGALLHRDERLTTERPQATLAEAVRRYQTLLRRPDVLALFDAGRAWHEVPV